MAKLRKTRVQPWSADFNEDGTFSITPDTPATRADLANTLHDFHSGNLVIVEAKWQHDDVAERVG